MVGRLAGTLAGTAHAPAAFASVAGLPFALWLGLACGFTAYAGAVWDVSWHRTIGRDAFWSSPHLMLYAGVGGGLLAACWALVASVRQPGLARGAVWQAGSLALPVAYLLAVGGGAGVVLTAPLDDLWHRLYGRDVDIWSVPHLAALASSAAGTFGWVAATVPYLRVAPARRAPGWRDAVHWGFVALLLYTGWFSLNWYHILASTRDAIQYSALVALVLLPALLLGGADGARRWTATIAAAAFSLLVLLPIPVLNAVGWQAPAPPPLLLVPAVILDLVRARLPARWPAVLRSTVLGVAFALAFLAVELAGSTFLPAPSAATSRFDLLIVRPYLAVAAARPWTLPSVAAALPVVLAASVVGASLGLALRDILRRVAGTDAPSDADRTAPAYTAPTPAVARNSR